MEVLKGLHDGVGHPGRERMMRLCRERYFWPGMANDVVKYVAKCGHFIRRKMPVNSRCHLVNISTPYPLELVCTGYPTLEPSKGRSGNILVVTDHFTKYAVKIPTKNQTSRTNAKARTTVLLLFTVF